MTIDFNCPHCGQGLSAEQSSAGLGGECSACHQPIIVPNRIPTNKAAVQFHEEKQDTIDVRELARAIRFTLVSIVLGLSYLSLQSTLSIERFSKLLPVILGGKPLPALTQFVFGAAPLFGGISILVPIAVVAALFLRSVVRSFYFIGALGIVTIAQYITLYHALYGPLNQVATSMGATP